MWAGADGPVTEENLTLFGICGERRGTSRDGAEGALTSATLQSTKI